MAKTPKRQALRGGSSKHPKKRAARRGDTSGVPELFDHEYLKARVEELEAELAAEFDQIRCLFKQLTGHPPESLSEVLDYLAQRYSCPPHELEKMSQSEVVKYLSTIQRGHRKTPGRRVASYLVQTREAQLKADWEKAREAGVAKGEFARNDARMSLKDFDKLLDRVQKREKRSSDN